MRQYSNFKDLLNCFLFSFTTFSLAHKNQCILQHPTEVVKFLNTTLSVVEKIDTDQGIYNLKKYLFHTTNKCRLNEQIPTCLFHSKLLTFFLWWGIFRREKKNFLFSFGKMYFSKLFFSSRAESATPSFCLTKQF